MGPGGVWSVPNLRAIAKCHGSHYVVSMPVELALLVVDWSSCLRGKRSPLVVSNWDHALCLYFWDIFVWVYKPWLAGTDDRPLWLISSRLGWWAPKRAPKWSQTAWVTWRCWETAWCLRKGLRELGSGSVKWGQFTYFFWALVSSSFNRNSQSYCHNNWPNSYKAFGVVTDTKSALNKSFYY